MRDRYDRNAQSEELAAARVEIAMRAVPEVCDTWRAWKIDKVILFGSTAREECDSSSDVDLLVILPDDAWNKKSDSTSKAFMEVCREALRDIGAEVTFSFVRRTRYEKPEDYDLSEKMVGAIHDSQGHGLVLYDADVIRADGSYG